MSGAPGELRYVVLTPARNEVDRLGRLAASLAAQTVPPQRWIVIENGSSDGTLEEARSLAEKYPFIQVVEMVIAQDAPERGRPIVRALHFGLEHLDEPYDVALKLDADVTLDADYAERLLAEFAADPRLGVASGTCYEEHDGTWQQQHMTGAMVWCAARAWRSECLEAVTPFEERFGWDGVDIARARIAGWRTHTFTDLPFWHHRVEGERDGPGPASLITAGEGSHYLGYRPTYVLARALGALRRSPLSLLMLWGYLRAVLRRTPQLDDSAVVELLREEQRWRHLPRRAREARGQRDDRGSR